MDIDPDQWQTQKCLDAGWWSIGKGYYRQDKLIGFFTMNGYFHIKYVH